MNSYLTFYKWGKVSRPTVGPKLLKICIPTGEYWNISGALAMLENTTCMDVLVNIQKITILECKNGLDFSNTHVPVSRIWRILHFSLRLLASYLTILYKRFFFFFAYRVTYLFILLSTWIISSVLILRFQDPSNAKCPRKSGPR